MGARRVLSAFVFSIAWLAGCASGPDYTADIAVQTAPDPGTVFLFSDGRVERFLRIEDGASIWATRNGREYTRHLNPILPVQTWNVGERSGASTVFGGEAQLWPPAPGKRAQFRVLNTAIAAGRQRRTVQAWTCRVDQQERLDIAAGEFEVMPVVCELYSVSSMRLLERRTWWWSPELSHYVKRSYQSLRSGKSEQIELCAALPSYRAPNVRLEALLDACQGS